MFQVLDSDGNLLTSRVFDTPQAAKEWAVENGHKPRIKRMILDTNWREREQARFTSGEYKPMPSFIADAAWWQDHEPAKDHFVHIAIGDPSMVAYTPTPEHGAQDKQVRISFSTYLSRYFKGVLSSWDCGEFGHRYEQHNEAAEIRQHFKYGTTMDDFEKVYSTALKVCNPNSSAVSCMAWSMEFVKRCDLPRHPAVVYARELHIAYIEMPDGSIPARVNVHPERKTYVRVYGEDSRWQRRIQALLEEDGYRHRDDFDGVTLLAIKTHGNNYLMPYIDGEVQSAELVGDYFRLDSDGAVCCSNTRGTAAGSEYTCDHCGAGMDDPVDVEGDNWCENCADRYTQCCEYNEERYRAGNTAFYEVTVSPRGRTQTWSEYAVSDAAFYCERTEEYFAEYAFSQIEVVQVDGTKETWCRERAELGTDYFKCTECELYYTMACKSAHKDVCKDCADAEGFVAPTATPTIHDTDQLEIPSEA